MAARSDDRMQNGQKAPREPGPPAIEHAAPVRAFTSSATALMIVAVLYFARDVLIPLALGTLLAFILAPLVAWLRYVWIPKIAAITIATIFAVSVVAGISLAVGAQLVQLAGNVPSYQRNLVEKIGSVRAMAPAGDVLERLLASLRSLQEELSPKQPQEQEEGRPRPAEARPKPIPVIVEPGRSEPIGVIRTLIEPLLGPIGTAGLVVIFVVFILVEREELRDRFIRLVGGHDLQRSTQLITEAAERVSRYLLSQLLVNVSYGVPIGIALWLIGVPNAMLWGLLAAVLRFIPYIGPWIAAFFPVVIAIGSEPGWTMALWTIGLFVAMELVSNNVVEPLVYGTSTGLSSFAVILAAIVWTALWGPIGLVLSTPLTVCLVVIGKHIPQLAVLDLLLGRDPVLTPAERFYQRVLAGDVEEAIEVADAVIAESSALHFYDDVALEALRLAENDRQRSDDPAARSAVVASTEAVVADVVAQVKDGQLKEAKAAKVASGAVVPIAQHGRIVCIAGRTDLDLASARVLAAHLERLGFTTEVRDARMLAPHGGPGLDLTSATAVCVCYLNPRPRAYVRYVCRRLHAREQGLPTLLCLWNLAPDTSLAATLETCGPEARIVTTLREAERALTERVDTAREPFSADRMAVAPACPDERTAPPG